MGRNPTCKSLIENVSGIYGYAIRTCLSSRVTNSILFYMPNNTSPTKLILLRNNK